MFPSLIESAGSVKEMGRVVTCVCTGRVVVVVAPVVVRIVTWRQVIPRVALLVVRIRAHVLMDVYGHR